MTTRRTFLNSGGALLAGAALSPSLSFGANETDSPQLSRPTPAQMAWQDCEIGLLYSFDLPIFEKHQPNSVFYHSSRRSDHRWVGNEAGRVRFPSWATMPKGEDDAVGHNCKTWKRYLASGDPNGTVWSPGMADAPLRNHNWFWKPDQEKSVRSVNALMGMIGRKLKIEQQGTTTMIRQLFQLAILPLAGLLAVSANAAPERPNVILIMTDDQGFGDLGCHGNPLLKTPHIDRLAAESVQLTNFHVHTFCSPTRATLMSGLHPWRTGVTRTTNREDILRTDVPMMADYLRASGLPAPVRSAQALASS